MQDEPVAPPPNIVLILADDMGFSDLGCYGAEIQTPNLDRLASSGLRFSQMYNFARCCPSRAALLTGLYPQQAGVGHMAGGIPGVRGYEGYLNRGCVTVAEVLRAHGYRTHISGKWHVGSGHGDPDLPPEMRRGFDRLFGIGGGGSYFHRDELWRDATPFRNESSEFYLTDAITDNAIEMIDESAARGRPFFVYVAYTAPHWPLQAPEEDIAKYENTYRSGWDSTRTGRHEQMKGLGILDKRWAISARDEDAPPWGETPRREWEARRMAVYAAQIDRMDRGVGRIMDRLRAQGLEENTLVIFLSDNGGCAEFLREDGGRQPDAFLANLRTMDGRPVRVGNDPSIMPGPEDTYMSYDVPWANVSTTPFRRYKRWVHEGGIATPLIVRWPARIREPRIVHEPAQIIDVTATCIDAVGARYPALFEGNEITPIEGESLLPVIEGRRWSREKPMFWEHEGNRAVRAGQWKLVSEAGSGWELYDMETDRTELHDLAASETERVREMAKLYAEWAERCDVAPWPINAGGWKFPGMNADGSFQMRGRHGHMI